MKAKRQILILLMGAVLMMAFFSVKGIQVNRIASTQLYQYCYAEDFGSFSVKNVIMSSKAVASLKRIISIDSCNRDKWVYELSEKDYEALLKIVEAEAGGEDEIGKMLVANVVLNRVKSDSFPDSVEEVVMQNENGTYQFSPVGNGRFEGVQVSEETVLAVEKALEGEDVSEGDLYFVAAKYAQPEKLKWFQEKLTLLFSHGGHEFYG